MPAPVNSCSPRATRPTLGPLSHNPSTADGVHLSVVTSLLDDTPVFNGDFADPSALPTTDSIYVYSSSTVSTAYAAGAHIPVIELPAASGFEGTYSATPCRCSRTGRSLASSGDRRSGQGQTETYVLYYATPAVDPLDCVYNRAPWVRADRQAIEFGDVHIASDQLESFGPVRRRLGLGLHLSHGSRWCHRSERVRRI